MSLRHEINITTKWGKLFKVKCLHDFYEDGITPDFTFMPTGETAVLMRNHRLLFRPQKAGFIVLYNTQQVEDLLLRKKINQLEKLTFIMKITNKFFLNFSAVSFENLNRTHYLSNSFSKKSELNLIHPKTFLENSPNIEFLSKNRELQFSFPDLINTATIKLTNSEGANIHLNKLLQRKLPKKIEQIWFPARRLSSGKYTLSAKGKWSRDFYVMDQTEDHVWGIVDIFLTGKNTTVSVFNENGLLKPDFHIQFRARETYWKYILINQQQRNKKYSDAKVSLNGKEIKFSKPKSMTLNDGTEAHFIESKSTIKLEQNISDSHKLELKLKNGVKWLPRTVKLPKPATAAIKPDKETDKIYSVTYVYL